MGLKMFVYTRSFLLQGAPVLEEILVQTPTTSVSN